MYSNSHEVLLAKIDSANSWDDLSDLIKCLPMDHFMENIKKIIKTTITNTLSNDDKNKICFKMIPFDMIPSCLCANILTFISIYDKLKFNCINNRFHDIIIKFHTQIFQNLKLQIHFTKDYFSFGFQNVYFLRHNFFTSQNLSFESK